MDPTESKFSPRDRSRKGTKEITNDPQYYQVRYINISEILEAYPR